MSLVSSSTNRPRLLFLALFKMNPYSAECIVAVEASIVLS